MKSAASTPSTASGKGDNKIYIVCVGWVCVSAYDAGHKRGSFVCYIAFTDVEAAISNSNIPQRDSVAIDNTVIVNKVKAKAAAARTGINRNNV